MFKKIGLVFCIVLLLSLATTAHAENQNTNIINQFEGVLSKIRDSVNEDGYFLGRKKEIMVPLIEPFLLIKDLFLKSSDWVENDFTGVPGNPEDLALIKITSQISWEGKVSYSLVIVGEESRWTDKYGPNVISQYKLLTSKTAGNKQ